MKSGLKAIAFFLGVSLFSMSCSTTRPLEGKWSCTTATVDGKLLPESATSPLRLTLTGERYKTERGFEVLFDSTYSIDPGKNPKQITMIGTEGDLTGKKAQGIYVVHDDTLQICYTMPGRPRPGAFESRPGSGAYLITWKRQKP